MKILVFSPSGMRSGSGSGIRARLIAQGLRANGAEVAVVTQDVPPSFSEQGILSYANSNGQDWGSLIDRALLAFHPDVLYGITEAGADILVGYKNKFGCKLAFDIHGIGIIEILELGKEYGPRYQRIRQSWNWLRSVQKSDIITIANPMLYRYAKIFNTGKRIILPVIGLTDIEHFNPSGDRIGFEDQNKIQVVYSGNLYKWQGVPLFIETAKLANRLCDNFQFSIIGSIGSNYAQINQTLLHSLSIKFCETIDYDAIPTYYRAADIFVIPREFLLSTYLAFPQKLCDFMAMGKLIIASDLAPHRFALKDPACGLLAKPNPKSFLEALEIGTDQSLREKFGALARKIAIEKYNHIKQTKKILDVFEKF